MAIRKFFFLMLSAFSVYALDDNSTTLPTQRAFLETLLNITESQIVDFTGDFDPVRIPKEDVKFVQYFPNSIKTTEINSHHSLNPEHPTKIIIHGFLHDAQTSWVKEMAFLYHQKGNYNVIAVDWSKHASLLPGYFHSASATQGAGFRVGEFILDIENHIPKFLQNLHLIGHSLGAHVAGFAGKKVINEHFGYIDRITGIDAAGPLFETPSTKPPHLRLDRTDAVVVDLIHTNMGLYGVSDNYGTVDFYVNKGGPIQPGCVTSVCSHNYAHRVFSQTIKDPKGYKAVLCPNALEYEVGLCDGNVKGFMGDEVTRNASGTFYLDVETGL